MRNWKNLLMMAALGGSFVINFKQFINFRYIVSVLWLYIYLKTGRGSVFGFPFSNTHLQN